MRAKRPAFCGSFGTRLYRLMFGEAASLRRLPLDAQCTILVPKRALRTDFGPVIAHRSSGSLLRAFLIVFLSPTLLPIGQSPTGVRPYLPKIPLAGSRRFDITGYCSGAPLCGLTGLLATISSSTNNAGITAILPTLSSKVSWSMLARRGQRPSWLFVSSLNMLRKPSLDSTLIGADSIPSVHAWR